MRHPPKLAPRRGGRSQRLVPVALMLARVLSLLVCFELSGLHRELTEVLVLSGYVTAQADDCSGELPHDCPPGCAACHCSAGVALPPEPRERVTLDVPLEDRGPRITPMNRVPAAPHLPGLYRPPRS